MAHSFFITGDSEQSIAEAEAHISRKLGIEGRGNPDLVSLRYGLFSVEDARKLSDVAHAAPVGERKAIIISVTRFFHEAQNALLKIFEEPPEGVTLFLVIPSEGILLPTLRSRLTSLPRVTGSHEAIDLSDLTREFLGADDAAREKLIAKLVDRSKSDKDEEKQSARNEAMLLAEGLLRAASAARPAKGSVGEDREIRLLMDDLLHFLPLLHTRSAPLKLIYEHVRLVIPKGLQKEAV